MIDQQLKLLARLAGSDGYIDDSELKFIVNLGSAHGISAEKVAVIIKEPQGEMNYNNLSDDERFEYLYNLVHIMKVDGEVYNQEIEFCERIAKKLGYQLAAVYEIYPHVHPRVRIPNEIKKLKQQVSKYLSV